MAAYLQNLTNESLQRHTIITPDGDIVFVLKFLPSVERWFFDVTYKGKIVLNVALALGGVHIESSNLPFDFVVEDLSKLELDPFRLNDFQDDRCKIIFLDADDMRVLRGVKVEV